MSHIKQMLRTSRFSLIPIICFLSVLTYENTVPESIRTIIVYGGWMLLFIEVIFTCKKNIPFLAIKYFSIIIFFFAGVALLSTFFASINYFNSPTIHSLYISLFVFIIGLLAGRKLNENDVVVCFRWYMWGAVILSLFFFIKGIPTGFNLNSRQYFSLDKNSMGQIIATAACILILDKKGLQSRKTLYNIIIGIFLIVNVFLLRSRTSILCFAFSLLIILASRVTSKKVKRWMFVFAVVFVVILFTNDTLRNVFFNGILLANRSLTDLNDLTSGRFNIYLNFGNLMNGNWLSGNGGRYYESFYLSAFVQFGFVVGSILILSVLYVIGCTRKVYRHIEYGFLLYILAISYSMNGVFEGLPPVGPGIKNFALWLLLGFGLAHYSRKDLNDSSGIEKTGVV